MVRKGFSAKVTLEHSPEERKGLRCVDVWGKNILGRGIASGKTLLRL